MRKKILEPVDWREATRAAFGPTKPKARRRWKGAFPDLMEFRLSDGDVESNLILDREIAPYAYIQIERATSSADYARLDAIADRIIGKEKWNHGLEPVEINGYFGFLWPSSDVSAPPIGLVTFSVGTDIESAEEEESEENAPLPIVGFEFHLAFVKKAYRGKGFGLFLGCAVHEWLQHCKVTSPRCPKRGTTVYYHADFYSGGGEAISNLVTQSFRVLQERFEMGEAKLPWQIAEFEEDTGF